MSDIHEWSSIASENNQTPPNGWPENTMTLGQINNTAREMMSVIARWFLDTSGALGATGLHYEPSLNAWGYNLTTYRAYFLNNTFEIKFRIPQVNVGPCWLNLNGVWRYWILWPDGSHCRANDLADIVELHWHPNGFFVLSNLQRRQVGEFSTGAGVQMLFAMGSAPSGWVQSAAWHDRLIRVVSHGGGGAGGQWAIFGMSTESANHTHGVTVSGGINGSTSSYTPGSVGVNSAAQVSVATHSGHSHTFYVEFGPYSYTTSGISNGHTHWGDGSWRPAYGDVIMCVKS